MFRQVELEAVLAGGETPLISGPGLFVVGGDAVVHAVAGIVDASDHAEVFASSRAAVRARDHARIWIEGEVHADAYDSAVVIAKGRCRVRAADRVRVWAENGVVVTRDGPSVSVRRAGMPSGTAVSARPARRPASPAGPASTHPADPSEARPQ